MAKTLAVPPGMMPTGTQEWTMPLTTSLMVPSPPAARIKSAPSETQRRAMAGAVPAPVVGKALTA